MIEYIKFLYQVFRDISDESKQKEFIISKILYEARFNNDLVEIILRSRKENNYPIWLFNKFEISSFKLLSIISLPVSAFLMKKDLVKMNFLLWINPKTLKTTML